MWICAHKTACLAPELQVSMCPRPHLWICEHKTVCLAPQLQVSLGPSGSEASTSWIDCKLATTCRYSTTCLWLDYSYGSFFISC